MRTRRAFLRLVGESALGGLLARPAAVAIGTAGSSLLSPRPSHASCPGALITLVGGGSVLAVNVNEFFGFSEPLVGGMKYSPTGGCQPSDYGAAVTNKLAVARAGNCSIDVQATAAQSAGAIGVIVVSSPAAPGFPAIEGPIPGISIPVFGVRFAEGNLILQTLALNPSINALITRATIENCGPIPFASLAVRAGAFLRPRANDDEFAMRALFTLGTASNGINLATDSLTFTFGPGHWTVPAGSFEEIRAGSGWFKFQGFIGTTFLALVIGRHPNGSFEFDASGTGAELTGISNPVPVSLTIGNDSGSATVLAEIRP